MLCLSVKGETKHLHI